MNSKIKSIILNHLNSNEKAMLKISNANSLSSLSLKMPLSALKENVEHLLLIKNDNNIYKKRLKNDVFSTYQLNTKINLDSKISVLIVRQYHSEQTPIFWGGTNCVNAFDCENEVQEDKENLENIENSCEYSKDFQNCDNSENTEKQKIDSNDLILNNNESINFDTRKNSFFLNKNIEKENYNLSTDDNSIQYKESNIDSKNAIIDDNISDSTLVQIKENEALNFDEEKLKNAPQFNIIEGKNGSYSSELFDYSEQEVEEEIDYFMSTPEIVENNNRCASCKYKEEFYEQEKLKEAKNTLKEIAKMQKEETIEKTPQYFSLIESQYNEMFNRYPQCEELINVLPNSKWVRVDVEDESYVLGLIFENNQVQYLCYGVPQNHKESAPPELQEISQWLPIDALNPNGYGYWIMYQSAETGDTIKIDII